MALVASFVVVIAGGGFEQLHIHAFLISWVNSFANIAPHVMQYSLTGEFIVRIALYLGRPHIHTAVPITGARARASLTSGALDAVIAKGGALGVSFS